MRGAVTVVLFGVLVGATGSQSESAERHLMSPLVPADKLAEARALTSPVPDSPEIVEKGKSLYNGKGGCFNCHGKDGAGNGPAAIGLDPAPRNFHRRGFWRHRTEGEIFWVIKHGSPGTSMIGFGDRLSDEEIWTIIKYERSFAGEHGRGSMDHRGGMGPRRGPRGGMGGMKHGGPRDGMRGCEAERCGQ